MRDKLSVLKEYFGHDSFREGQDRITDSLLGGHDVLGIMPTGAGKSICYQVPALMFDGITIVVSPLISLMKDQVSALVQSGVAAAYINSSLTHAQYLKVLQNTESGKYKIIYVAPERLCAPAFLGICRNLNISMVAVDEAHCVSQWGQDFRPSYLKIPDFIDALNSRPVVGAFTATATGAVRDDIKTLLRLVSPLVVTTGFDRPNLFFSVMQPKNKSIELMKLIKERKNESGIVYCSTRKAVEEVCELLQKNGFAATRYHAGLDENERRRNQDDFVYDRAAIMVATNAFGMGIDKSNVSFVIHYNMPKDMESYYQEAGRAGRDGSPGECILLYAPGDVQTAKFLIENGGNEDLPADVLSQVRQADEKRLRDMTGYCKTSACLRGYILSYFGQSHPESCGCCGNCKTVFRMRDVTVPAQMVLSCVYRVHEKLGYFVGRTLIVRVLRGSRDARVLELGLDKLSTYNLMQDKARELNALCDFLEENGYLFTDPEHHTLEPGVHAADVLFRGKQLLMPVREENEPKLAAKKSGKKASAQMPAADDLFSVLRETRMHIAQRENVPAYIVCSNSALLDMAEKAPETMDALLDVSGIGEVKACRYGDDFLTAIRDYKHGKL